MIKQYEYFEEEDFDTLLDTDVQFVGKIESKESNLIKGKVVDSNVQSHMIVIVETGLVSGKITADMLSILGTCVGEVSVNNTLALLKGGRLEGTTNANTMVVGEGGILNSQCKVYARSEEQGM